MVKLRLHSAGAASLLHPNAAAALGAPGLTALLLPRIQAGMLGRLAWSAGRIAALGATTEFQHGLLGRVVWI